MEKAMQKRIYLVKKPSQLSFGGFKSKIMDQVIPGILACHPMKLKLGITEEAPPRFGVLPLRPEGLALISVWGEIGDIAALLREVDARAAGYLVDEAVPVAYERDWKDGEVSPGATLLTLMKKKPELPYEDFIREWHGRHTPLAMKIHPLWNYTRNVVCSAVIPGSPEFQGIVEEHFRSKRDSLNPVRMFGGFPMFIPNMIRIARHVNTFLDIPECENYLLSEVHVRS